MWPLVIVALLLAGGGGSSTTTTAAPQQTPPQPAPGQNTGQVVADNVKGIVDAGTSLVESFKKFIAGLKS